MPVGVFLYAWPKFDCWVNSRGTKLCIDIVNKVRVIVKVKTIYIKEHYKYVHKYTLHKTDEKIYDVQWDFYNEVGRSHCFLFLWPVESDLMVQGVGWWG